MTDRSAAAHTAVDTKNGSLSRIALRAAETKRKQKLSQNATANGSAASKRAQQEVHVEMDPPLAKQRRNGSEPFHNKVAPLQFTLREFWAWASSDLVSNSLRGVIAEYLVAQALGIADGVRREWHPYDLRLGETKIEVKSAAYIQTWAQKKAPLVRPVFDIAATRYWNPLTNKTYAEPRRHAHVWVFALLRHRNRKTVDPLDVAQWRFFVVPRHKLNENFPTQKTIGLIPMLRLLGPDECRFDGVRRAVEIAAAAERRIAMSGSVRPGVDSLPPSMT